MDNKHESFESLWEYCISSNRACPMSIKWSDFFNKLKDKETLNLPLFING